MPLYDFVCQDCEHPFEMLVRDDSTRVECPACHGKKVQRMLPLPARPPSTTPARSATACNSSGPPCGPMCSRFPQ